jgi:hypothetical protein
VDVAQQDAGIQTGGGDERVAQRVRADLLGQPGRAGDAADDPPAASTAADAPPM